MQKTWLVIANEKRKTKNEKGVVWIIEKLLENRGVPKKDWQEFLDPKSTLAREELIPLFEKKEFEKALKLINLATFEHWPIVIHGDYDVDGLTATAVLWEAFHYGLNYQNVSPFIPHRLDHGYGLTRASLDEIRSSKTFEDRKSEKLLITVDCGITAVDEVEYAKDLGFKVLVLDHHVKPQKLPAADAILHTTDLCAAGIAWVLSSNLKSPISNFQPPTSNLELVALATIADLQPLLGLNRKLTQLGLAELNQTRRLGLRQLIKVAGIENRRLGPYEVGFILAPRLNAMGRLEHALESLRILCTRNSRQAWELAQRLNKVNSLRQRLTDEAVLQAQAQLSQNLEDLGLTILASENWHEGIIGLIAAKLTEQFSRPTIVIAKGERYSKASARSVNGFNIVEAIRSQENLLVEMGGHAMAAGFTIETEKIATFKKGIRDASQKLLTAHSSIPTLKIDFELATHDLSWELYSELKLLEPHGIGNPRPLFLTRGLKILEVRPVGKNLDHLKLVLGSDDLSEPLSAIGFSLAPDFPNLRTADTIDLVYCLDEDSYNGAQKLELKIQDLRLAESEFKF